jgi:hypothetical protein
MVRRALTALLQDRIILSVTEGIPPIRENTSHAARARRK